MSTPVITVLVVLALASVAFILDIVSAELVALGTMLSLIILGVITPDAAFHGFGSDTVMMILGLLIMTAALLRTGVVDMIGKELAHWCGADKEKFLLFALLAVATLSAFISNTAAMAVFLPVIFGAALKLNAHPAEFLMPVAFASILTSSVTLISTSTNIVVSDLLQRQGLAEMGLFELAPVGVPIAVVGIAYLWFFGRRLIPQRGDPHASSKDFGLRPFLAEILVQSGASIVGKSIAESGFGHSMDLGVLRIRRPEVGYVRARAHTVIKEGDILLVEGARDEILKIKEIKGLELKPDAHLRDPDVEPEELTICESVICPGSRLIGRTLKALHLRERYDVQVLGINRTGELVVDKISQVPLRLGDILLLQGVTSALRPLQDDRMLQLLTPVGEAVPRLSRAPIAALAFALALILAATSTLGLATSVLVGAFAVMVTGCITPEEAYRRVDWRLLILIGSMLSLGAAMEQTGTAKYLAGHLLDLTGTTNGYLVLSAFFFLTVVLTQAMSNQAAAVVIVPIAVQAAAQAGFDPRSLVMMIAVAASCSYLTPLEPACLMVFGPGRYRFLDFAKVGAPLTVIIYLIAVALVPIVWPLM